MKSTRRGIAPDSRMKSIAHNIEYCGLEYPVDMSGNMHFASKLQELLRLGYKNLKTQKVR